MDEKLLRPVGVNRAHVHAVRQSARQQFKEVLLTGNQSPVDSFTIDT
jgi:hypothetical protein